MEFLEDKDFITNILNRFRDSDVGRFIRGNKIVQIIGYTRYCARRAESSKINEVRKEIMTEMRELTRLFFHFRIISPSDVSVEDMYKRKHIKDLKMAMNTMCEGNNEGEEKHGLKLNIHATFQKSLKIFKGYLSESMKDQEKVEVEHFQDAFKFSSPQLLAKARYETEKNSMHKARLPKNLPGESEMKTMKHFIEGQLGGLVNNFHLNQFTLLRSLIVARLTLYNGRRGEEPSRMLMSEYLDALAGKWIPKNLVEAVEDEAEKYLYGRYKLVYLHGKGKKYVPVLVPIDLMRPIEILLENREGFGITEDNMFLFGTKSSNAHCSGWHAVNQICSAAGVQVNATRNRHRLSSVYASLDMSDADRRIFMDHLGHKEEINKENYQCPPGMKEIRVMGKFLEAAENSASCTATDLGGNDSCMATDFGVNDCCKTTDLAEVDNCEDSSHTAVPTGLNYGGSNATSSSKSCREAPTKRQSDGRFRWSVQQTKVVQEHFKDWLKLPKGNSLPSKKELEKFLQTKCWTCSVQKLRTKIMNEQNKYQRMRKERLKELFDN